MEEIECVVIGAGVVGLACAAAIAGTGRDVMVLEREAAIGTHTSSRNSEVIHAGIYYAPGSLKARLCIAGKQRLYAYATERGIAYRNTGKLIVATSEEQLGRLQAIRAGAEASGVGDLEFWTAAQVANREPAVASVGGLFSPSTGIVDSHALMLALEGDLETHGGMVVLQTPVEHGWIEPDGIALETGGPEPMRLKARNVVNCAGPWAPELARRIAGVDPGAVPEAHFAIGHYYRLSGRSPTEALIYPVPEPGGLGIHLTVDLGGQAKFGPDVRWIDGVDYSFDDSRFDSFVAAIRAYLPDLDADRLAPDYTGIRPKIVGAGEPAADFRIDGEAAHGVPGLVNLFGIESPGLTASLAIGEHVAAMLRR